MVSAAEAVRSPFHPWGTMQTEDIQTLHDCPGIESGAVRLWFAVLVDCFISIRDGWGNQETARLWIQDPENVFFEAVADHLGYDSEGLRRRIRSALQRAAKVERQTWQDRIRERMRREGE